MVEEEKVKDKKELKEAKLVEVPTQFGVAIELESGDVVDETTLLIRIYNKLLRIERSVA